MPHVITIPFFVERFYAYFSPLLTPPPFDYYCFSMRHDADSFAAMLMPLRAAVFRCRYFARFVDADAPPYAAIAMLLLRHAGLPLRYFAVTPLRAPCCAAPLRLRRRCHVTSLSLLLRYRHAATRFIRRRCFDAAAPPRMLLLPPPP